ncbi:TPA: low temperature requirement protein A [Streptococcus suis]|uniref:low temperature requirement protein A n=1 Tax=Streptococcus suis TaxID=1307 RepID=UPI0011462197|nr:low temperature requirement protein A [Streptococcus suis]MDW8575767.1 low temperature requirement protein A [Streptococcus suis]MDW8589753.1 low temperature requirement protein A [Streptococcus suis]MDW8615669.1 low temperature requirement protein A [Streptococcus suis]TQE80427.1 low temperature requirement protein A [Streptococcus suis]HEM2786209.1 low temperature requirement protein A [Streptococcus suis]
MPFIKHKKVELTELFYDLVYVYTISQLTSIIHHAHQGVVSLQSFFNFSVGLIIFVNSWMVQTVFTNRFGSNSLRNIIFMFLQMICLLVASSAVAGDWQTSFVWIFLPMAIISLLLLVQYILEYFQTSNDADRSLMKQFFYILGLRSVMLFLSLFFPYEIGMWIALVGILTTWLLPGLLSDPNRGFVSADLNPVNFPHLIERLSLLVIITFGESLIGISEHFSPENFSWESIAIFITLTNLFMVYIVEVDHLLDVEREETGIRAIYSHYPILFGLSLITIALSFFGNGDMNAQYTVFYFYGGLVLFILGLLQHNAYNKQGRILSKQFQSTQLLLISISFGISLLVFTQSWSWLIVTSLIVTSLMMIGFVGMNLGHSAE